MSETPTPSMNEVQPKALPLAPAENAQSQKTEAAETQAVPMPRNPESFAMATLKGAAEAGATFVREAATPQSQATTEVTPVRLFDKEPASMQIPDAVRDAFRQKTAEQMLGIKREEKAEQPARARTEKPKGAPERKAENTRQQKIALVRTELAQAGAK